MKEAADADSQRTARGTELVQAVAQTRTAPCQMKQTGRGHQQQPATQPYHGSWIEPLDRLLRRARSWLNTIAGISGADRGAAAAATHQRGDAQRHKSDRESHPHKAESGCERAVNLLTDGPGRREPDAAGHEQTAQDRS